MHLPTGIKIALNKFKQVKKISLILYVFKMFVREKEKNIIIFLLDTNISEIKIPSTIVNNNSYKHSNNINNKNNSIIRNECLIFIN